MSQPPFRFPLASEEDTTRLGRWFADHLGAGDVVALEGPIGAGKTHFARALIRARLGTEEDVPSPTFTLIQTYPAEVEVWHADLYRLTHPDEVLELGLEDAFATAICLIEWPERMGALLPADAIHLRLIPDGDQRLAEVSTGDRPALAAALAKDWAGAIPDRPALSAAFLDRAGWGTATRRPLAGDASDRRYDRLTRGADRAVLMDAPPGTADDPADFIRIADHLSGLGLSPPRILDRDLPHGFLLLEDLGDRLVATEAADPVREAQLYRLAVDVLVHLQAHPAPSGLPDLTAADWADAASFAPDWYRFAVTGDCGDRQTFRDELLSLLAARADGPRVLILRDYHAENLLWLPDRPGLAALGLLDFQLGQMGQPGYDLVSLLQDARRDVPPALERELTAHFATAKGLDPAAFARSYAVLGAQRALRILGIFARLCLKGGKPGYLPLLPHVWGQLQRNLAHPDLAPLRAVCNPLLPEPTPDIIARIGAQCGTFPHR